MDKTADISRFLDVSGRIIAWPSKQNMKLAVLEYLAGKFEYDKLYTEREVNLIITDWHSFGDYFLLRRGLIDYKLLCRKRDGSSYWREQNDDNNAAEL